MTSQTTSVAILCSVCFLQAYLLVSVFPYAAYMVVFLWNQDVPDTIENGHIDSFSFPKLPWMHKSPFPVSLRVDQAGPYACFLATSFMIGRTITAHAFGRLADAYGRRFAVVSSLVASGFACLWFGFSDSYVEAVVARCVVGACNSIVGVTKTMATELAYFDFQNVKDEPQKINDFNIGEKDSLQVKLCPDQHNGSFQDESHPRSEKREVESNVKDGQLNGTIHQQAEQVQKWDKQKKHMETRIVGLVVGMRAWGFLVAPAVAGFLADPLKVRTREGVVPVDNDANVLLITYPYLLPSLLGSVLCWTSAVAAYCGIPETLPGYRCFGKDLFLWVESLCRSFPTGKKSSDINSVARGVGISSNMSRSGEKQNNLDTDAGDVAENNPFNSVTMKNHGERSELFVMTETQQPPGNENSTTRSPNWQRCVGGENTAYAASGHRICFCSIDEFNNRMMHQSEIHRAQERLPLGTCGCHYGAIEKTLGLHVDIDEEGNSANDLPQSQHLGNYPKSLFAIWSRRNTRYHLLAYWVYSIIVIAIDEAFPLYCISGGSGLYSSAISRPQVFDEGEGSGDLKEGGLSESEIGTALSLAGLIFAMGQYKVYTFLSDRFGIHATLSISIYLGVIPICFIPFASLLMVGPTSTFLHLPSSNGRYNNHYSIVFLSSLMGVTKVFQSAFFSSITIKTNRTVPGDMRSSMNAIGSVGASIAKAFGPLLSGFWMAFCLSWDGDSNVTSCVRDDFCRVLPMGSITAFFGIASLALPVLAIMPFLSDCK